jgi:hypothetical protein
LLLLLQSLYCVIDNGGIKAPTNARLFQQIAVTIVGRNSKLGDVVANLFADDDSDNDVDINHHVLPRREKTVHLHEEMYARIQKCNTQDFRFP